MPNVNPSEEADKQERSSETAKKPADFFEALRRLLGGRIKTPGKHGGLTPVLISVETDNYSDYSPDRSLIPSTLYLKPGDEVGWQLTGSGTSFTIEFLNQTPFENEKRVFRKDETAKIAKGVPNGSYHYELTEYTDSTGRKLSWSRRYSNCPEIIIQK
jgi:plastocyanin